MQSTNRPLAAAALIPYAIIGAIAMVLIIAGLAGLSMPQAIPALAQPAVAWTLIGVGVVLDLIAGVQIVLTVRGHHRVAGPR